MAERVIKCPQCHAPLAPSRFARSIVCAFCSATVQLDTANVSVARFREARARWNDPGTHGYGSGSGASSSVLELDGSFWALGQKVGAGELSDVFLAERARRPTEHAVVKILRDSAHADLFDREWEVLRQLQQSTARGAALLTQRLPQPIERGVVRSGTFEGRRAMILRRPHGHRHTLDDVRRAQPSGVDPRAAVWLWRRVLEILTFVHASGFVHAAVLPRHILIEDGEHGARLVGYSCASRPGQKLAAMVAGFEDFYPSELPKKGLAESHDLAMSARCMLFALGGRADGAGVRSDVPSHLRDLLVTVGRTGRAQHAATAWELREAVGSLAGELFGPPSFNPIQTPG